MVILISEFINETTLQFTFKAPKGKMYSIEDIHWTGIGAGGNRVMVFDLLFEERGTNLDISQVHPIAFFDGTNILTQDYEYTTPLKTKFVSVGLDSAVSFSGFLIIAGTLITASKVELIIEWFRKGK